MKALTQDLELPDRFTLPDAIAQPRDFNPNAYFNVLTRLSIQKGYQLDWVYFSDELGGKPLVYAREASQTPFATYAEFRTSKGLEPMGERSYQVLPYSAEFVSSIATDGSPEGFIQLINLAYGADQFHLWWHGNYNDIFIICDQSDIQPGMNGLEAFDISLPPEILAAAQDLTLTPTVDLTNKTATISVVVFTKWGGFYRDTFEVSRTFPHDVLDAKSIPLIDYDCGVAF
jgi:hypothetical protein